MVDTLPAQKIESILAETETEKRKVRKVWTILKRSSFKLKKKIQMNCC